MAIKLLIYYTQSLELITFFIYHNEFNNSVENLQLLGLPIRFFFNVLYNYVSFTT